MHMKLLAACPQTLWTLYSNELLFSPINNTSLKRCQTANASTHQYPPCGAWKKNESGVKHFNECQTTFLFSVSLRKIDFKASTTKHWTQRPYAVCGNPITLNLSSHYLHSLSSFLFLSLLFCQFSPMGLKLIILSKESWDSACFSNFSPQIPHIFDDVFFFVSVMEYKLHSVYNKSSLYIDHSKSLFVEHTNRCVFCHCVPFALLSPPLMGVHAQPSVKDKGTFWPRQIALEQGCSLPPPPCPQALHTHTHRWTHIQTHAVPFPPL